MYRIDATQVDLGLDVDTNIVNIEIASVSWSSIHEKVEQHWG